jgi:FKBP-type peptidyl-prolyl cis-trans isomerase SlyD
MQCIADRKAVALTYSITTADGAVVEQHDVPITYVHGSRSGLFDKIAAALEGKCAGDRVEVSLAPSEGFGEHDPGLTFTDDIANVPPQFQQLGAEVEMVNEHGEPRLFRVTRIADARLTVDANHPFAGQTVTFHVNVVDVRDATPAELAGDGARP